MSRLIAGIALALFAVAGQAQFTETFTGGNNGDDLDTLADWTATTAGASNATLQEQGSDGTLQGNPGGGSGSGWTLYTNSNEVGSADNGICVTIESDWATSQDVGGGLWFAIRVQDANNFFGIYLPGTGSVGFRIVRIDAGSVASTLRQAQGAAGDEWCLEFSGNDYEVFRNDVSQTTGTDSTYNTETTVGVIVDDSNGSFPWADTFENYALDEKSFWHRRR